LHRVASIVSEPRTWNSNTTASSGIYDAGYETHGKKSLVLIISSVSSIAPTLMWLRVRFGHSRYEAAEAEVEAVGFHDPQQTKSGCD